MNFWLGWIGGMGTGLFFFVMGLRWEWRYRSIDKIKAYRESHDLPIEGTK